ncbi:hypothetical protein FA95DRAFT_1607593 [Auriscalpium vulgare]|uniref:Uncharacterized protein n=1 Tax=Auriscalpium vulgare TaxID=40419 RepID=A0ACB8RN64_9AGAM|nr:hypothetical protein FA95DRAFT_1607593 [Auriscalpium vulgare]
MLRPATRPSAADAASPNYTDEEHAEDHNPILHAKRLAVACSSSNTSADPASDAIPVVVDEAAEPEADTSGITVTQYATSLPERQPSFVDSLPMPSTNPQLLQDVAETADCDLWADCETADRGCETADWGPCANCEDDLWGRCTDHAQPVWPDENTSQNLSIAKRRKQASSAHTVWLHAEQRAKTEEWQAKINERLAGIAERIAEVAGQQEEIARQQDEIAGQQAKAGEQVAELARLAEQDL